MAELATERMVVAASAEAVFRRGERHREIPGVGGRHQAGVGHRSRPRGASGRGDVPGRGLRPQHELHPAYDYSGSPQTLAWKQTAGDLTSKLDGQLPLRAAGDGTTEVTYTLEVELRVPLPGFIKRRAQSRIMHTALEELKARVESSLTT